MDMLSCRASGHLLTCPLRQINRFTVRRPWIPSRKLGSSHGVRAKDLFYYGERPKDRCSSEDEETTEELDYDKDAALKRYAEYAPPEHFEKIKKYMGEESSVWRKQGFPCNSDDLDEDVTEDVVKVDHRMSEDMSSPSLEQSVTMDATTGLTSEDYDMAQAEYWCSDEPGGRTVGYSKVKKVKGKRFAFVNAKNPGENRIPISEVKKGQVFKGMVTEAWLLHGLRIDFGAEYDALVYISEDEWNNPVLGDALNPGLEVTIKIYKVYDEIVFRWPIHCELLEPNIMPLISPPSKWPAPLDWTKKSFRETLKISERTVDNYKVLVPEDEDTLGKEAAERVGLPQIDVPDPETEEKLLAGYLDEMAYSADLLVEQIDNFETWGYSPF